MAKLEYTAECLCTGKITCLFKKPTRMQHSVYRTHCAGCKSEYMFLCELKYNDKGKLFVTSHELINKTDKLEGIIKLKIMSEGAKL